MELGVIIGTAGRNIARSDALSHVFGYTVINDLSAANCRCSTCSGSRARASIDFCPMGPVVVTADEFGDPQRKRSAAPRQRRHQAGRDHRAT